MTSITRVLWLCLVLLIGLTGEKITPPAAAQGSPPVLAFYYAWFDQNTWGSGQAADTPLEPYNSADRATIERHVVQAQSAGIDALVQSWYGPAENPTETNFRSLLEVAQARGFKAAVDFEVTSPFLGDSGTVTNALATLLATHAQHPAYFRHQGKPVIFFWRQQKFSVETWAAIRNQVDPGRGSYWVAEGTDISYQAIFDGHHLYSIAWAGSPAGELSKWADRVRSFESDHEVDRLWIATVMPGYNDTRLPRANSFAVSRRNGDYYRETWQGALASQPDMLILTSFNEWLEGTQVEPSITYGNLYLDVTRELVTALRGSPPPEPIPVAAAVQQAETPTPPGPTPAGPYIRAGAIINVRSGSGATFTTVGQLPTGSMALVTGQAASGEWWQIDFAAGPEGKGWVSAGVVEFVGERAAVPVVEAATPEAPTATVEVTPTPASEATSPPATATGQADSAGARVEAPAEEVNVRSGPGLNFELIGQLPGNSSARVVGRDETGEWWQIEYPEAENGLAWVADAVVEFSGNRNAVPLAVDQPSPTPTVPVIAGLIEVQEPVNVRDEPALDGVLIGGLYAGDSVEVLAVSEDGEWWQIEFPEGPEGTGWVAAEFVQFQGDRTAVTIFGIGTPTPTPGPTDTPTPLPAATPTLPAAPTFAPTATSVYQATAAALLEQRGTPDPALREGLGRRSGLRWGDFPWGIVAFLIVTLFLWYQFYLRRRLP